MSSFKIQLLIHFFFLFFTSTIAQSLKDISFGDETTFDVVTWNIEFFPKNNANTIDSVAVAMASINADVYALQEINDVEALQTLDLKLEDYSVYISPDQYSNLKLAYMVKNSLNVVDFFPIYSSSSYNSMFAGRPPLLLHLKVNKQDVYLINVHFKCCGNGQLDMDDIYDEENRRWQASNQIKTYIDSYLPEKSVIVLGDFNDLLEDSPSNNVFNSILSDTDNYLFVDFPILSLSSSLWSFPSWPSHLDHILITNDLFDQFNASSQSVQSINMPFYFANGFYGYDSFISDHLPVGVKLNFSISSLDSQNTKSLNVKETRDLQGRKVPIKTNELQILKYENGQVQKQIIIEQ